MTHPTAFFRGNRERLAEALKGGLVVMTAYEEMQRRSDQAFGFEQEANFWYVSGVTAPRWKLVYDGLRHHSWLVRPSLDEVERIFNGEADAQALMEASGADEVIDMADFEQVLRQLTRTHSTVYTVKPAPADSYGFVQNPAGKRLTQTLERIFPAVDDCTSELARLRAIKQPNELKAIERAVKLTVEAFNELHARLGSCTYEYEVEAVTTGMFRQRGAIHAYDPIVAAGKNACTLHYVANHAKLRSKQLVLCDIGASVDGYAADITRTYVRDDSTARQRAVLATLADAQAAIIALIKPGVPFATYLEQTERIMAGALKSLGLAADSDQALVHAYMPHAVSHGLGIDVHDSLGGHKAFQPGMVLTVEPGIYLPGEGIGTRIEDDIVVTDKGHRVLSGRLASNPAASLVS